MSRNLKNYVISYKYHRPIEGNEYRALLTAITSLGAWEFHEALCSTHLVQSASTADELYEELIDHFDRNSDDKLLVAEIGPPAWYNLQPEEWARERLGCLPSRPPSVPSSPSSL